MIGKSNVKNGIEECDVCGKPFLVSTVSFGVSHLADIYITCGDHVEWDEKYCKDNKEECEELQAELKERLEKWKEKVK